MTFDGLEPEHLTALLRFARVLTGERASAEDLVQDVVVRLGTRRGGRDDITHPDAYARRMLVNEYVSWGRKWFRIKPVADVPDAAVGRDEMSRLDDRDQLRAALVKLPRRQRAVLVLRYYGGSSDDEIATELGCSVSTVRSHASRALAALRIDLTDAADVAMEVPR